jgi:hypothetical protein
VLRTKPGVDLENRWLVFQFSADHTGLLNENRQPGRFANYACSDENLLGPTDASRSRAEKMKSKAAYSYTC